MLCERCHAHPATVHMVQVVNGHRKEEHLCSECAEKEHVFQKEQSFFGHGFFDSPLDHFFGGSMLGHLLEDPSGPARWKIRRRTIHRSQPGKAAGE